MRRTTDATSIGWAALAAAAAVLAGPAHAQWALEREPTAVTAAVASSEGRSLALECSAEAPETFFVVMDMLAKPRGLQSPAPLGFSIGGRRYRYRGTMEDRPGGVRRITAAAAFDDRAQQRMRRDLKRGVRVSVEDQSSYHLHAFNLRGSRAAVDGWEEACRAMWDAPTPPAEPADDALASRTFEPMREGMWRLERVEDRPTAFTEGLAGDRIGLACAPGGGTEWIIDVVSSGGPPASVLSVEIAGPSARVPAAAVRRPARESGLESFRSRFEPAEQRAILVDLGRGSGTLSVEAGGGRTLSTLPLDGARAVVSRLLALCRDGSG
ncbi:hypothetical protein [Jannaschia sp. W003]|uniref:hypothetical protein n=1 Tax=Jannaschia sp. W003 TaxID=2867012 RepID=UPI0021A6DA4D|nr:hypothetical protein [Jannaschia sp. W003]UWQ23118.1 hypothetical protein K3554_16195 [Jannaschia sp. W003]